MSVFFFGLRIGKELMFAVTVQQPWADLVARGVKSILTHYYPAKFRGVIAIHAARTGGNNGIFVESDISQAKTVLENHGIPALDKLGSARGAIVGVARLVDCVSLADATTFDQLQRDLGEFGPRRIGWILTEQREIPEPIFCAGSPGLWRLSDDVTAEIDGMLK